MKSKRTASLSDTRTNLSETEARSRRKSVNSFVEKSAHILHAYDALFKKPHQYSTGDADTQFRQSLRNYDNEFQLSKAFKLPLKSSRILKSLQSLEGIVPERSPKLLASGDSSTRRQKWKRVAAYQKEEPINKPPEIEKPFVATQIEEPEEQDQDIFYSPSSQLIEEQPSSSGDEQSAESVKGDRFELEPLEDLSERSEISFEPENSSPPEERSSQSYPKQDIPSPLDVLPEEEDVLEEEKKIEEKPETEGKMAEEGPIVTDLENVDDLIQQAESTVDQVITETQLMDQTPSATGGETSDTLEDKSKSEKTPITCDCQVDNNVLKELEDAEGQAIQTVKVMNDLKDRLGVLCQKEKMTTEESKELEENNRMLKQQMLLFEEKTKRIQFLLDQVSIFDCKVPKCPIQGGGYTEDKLPKVIVCGVNDDSIPKILFVDDKKGSRRSSPGRALKQCVLPPCDVMPQFAKKLSESYNMQEKLAKENAVLEGKRYQLQEDLIDKDHTVESLHRKLLNLRTEMRLVCQENCMLSDKLQKIESCPGPSSGQGSGYESYESGTKRTSKKKKVTCGKGRGVCPAEVESRLQVYSETTQQLEKQLTEMENEVKTMQSELVSVQKERAHLEQHRRMMAMPPCMPPPIPCAMIPPLPCAPSPCQGTCNPRRAEVQLRELREQYNRLQDDYKHKLTEVAGLRADTEKLKNTARDADSGKKEAEEKVRDLERELKLYKSEKNKLLGSKEQLMEQEQQLNVAKQRFRDAQDELEEVRALVQDQQDQMDDYRNKYLQAQQQVEEQRRQIDVMELENNRISEQVNLEIQRVKNQFQEKLQELTPLPDILKNTQVSLQEAKQMHLLAERNNEALVRELQIYKDKAAALSDEMERSRSDQALGEDEKTQLLQSVEELKNKIDDLEEEAARLKLEADRMEEIAEQNEKKVQEKLHEIAQLAAQLETVREESARQVARTKDRCETVRRSMQNQIAELERQLAHSRAQARQAQKDRDEIRQKMQSQINNLNENFEDAQMRIRNLQGHVNFLKNSYSSVFPGDNVMVQDVDACDCANNY